MLRCMYLVFSRPKGNKIIGKLADFNLKDVVRADIVINIGYVCMYVCRHTYRINLKSFFVL
jgi:hypothetical protein